MARAAQLLVWLGLLNLACDHKNPSAAIGPRESPTHAQPSTTSQPDDSHKTGPPLNLSPTPISATSHIQAQRSYFVAALGDSITDSHVGGGGYLQHLQRACPHSTFLNFGRGGDMVNQMLRRLKSDILPVVTAKHLDTLIVFGGVNDLYSDLTAGRKNPVIERDLSAIYELAHGAGLRVVAITVAPWGGFTKYWNPRRGQNTELLNSWILGQVALNRVDVVVDAYPLLSCGKMTELCPDYATAGQDGLHPGKVGHERLGQKLIQLAFADCR